MRKYRGAVSRCRTLSRSSEPFVRNLENLRNGPEPLDASILSLLAPPWRAPTVQACQQLEKYVPGRGLGESKHEGRVSKGDA